MIPKITINDFDLTDLLFLELDAPRWYPDAGTRLPDPPGDRNELIFSDGVSGGHMTKRARGSSLLPIAIRVTGFGKEDSLLKNLRTNSRIIRSVLYSSDSLKIKYYPTLDADDAIEVDTPFYESLARLASQPRTIDLEEEMVFSFVLELPHGELYSPWIEHALTGDNSSPYQYSVPVELSDSMPVDDWIYTYSSTTTADYTAEATIGTRTISVPSNSAALNFVYFSKPGITIVNSSNYADAIAAMSETSLTSQENYELLQRTLDGDAKFDGVSGTPYAFTASTPTVPVSVVGPTSRPTHSLLWRSRLV